jgi:dihydroorotate dehydrogenase
MSYAFLRKALFRLDAETAHGVALAALRYTPLAGAPVAPGGPLTSQVAGLVFPTPIGMAAGFDKDAQVPDALLGLGFGFAEVGSITPLPQDGNPKPRLFRLEEDRAVINRMGFNNHGAVAAQARLVARKNRGGVVGVNLGANKDAVDRIADYATGARMFAPLASYLAVNVSSPNTPGLRALQDEGALTALLDAVIAARDEHHDQQACAGQPPCGRGGRIVRGAVARDGTGADGRFSAGDGGAIASDRRGRDCNGGRCLCADTGGGVFGAALFRDGV